MTKQFEGKVALVTGAASGIGRASALAFAREGARPVLADGLGEGGEETVRIIQEAGGDALFVTTDVSKAAEVKVLIQKTVETYGRLDYAHNNAGIAGAEAPTAECTEENWDHTIAINLKGVWLCMKYEIPQMLKQGGGAIVNPASTAGLVGLRGIACLLCIQRWCHTTDARGGVGLRQSRDSRECCMPWRHSHADGRESSGYGSRGGPHRYGANRQDGQARRGCRSCRVVVFGRRVVCHWQCDAGGRRLGRTVVVQWANKVSLGRSRF